jgi:hypothetical protein
MKSKSYWRISILLTIAILLESCGGTATATQNPEEKPSPFKTEPVAKEVQTAYLAGDTMGYRVSMFVLYREMRLQSVKSVATRTIELIEYMKKHSADGLEPLLVAYLDTVAASDDQNSIQKVVEKMVALNGVVPYKQDPLINIAMPVGRYHTPLVLDFRADAMREILAAYIGFPAELGNSFALPTLEELVGDQETRKNLCQVPSQKDREGHVLAADQKRQENCAKTGSPGGNQGGPIAGGTDPLDACINRMIKESISANMRIVDAQACLLSQGITSDELSPDTTGADTTPERGLPGGSLTVLIADDIAAIAGVVVAAATVGTLIFEIYKYNQEQEQRQQDKALQEWKDAVKDYNDAANAVAKAENAVKDAINAENKAYDEWVNAEKRASDLSEQNAPESDQQAAIADADAKKAAYEQAKKDREKAQRDAQKTKADMKKAAEKAEAAKPSDEKKDQLEPNSNSMLTDPACFRTIYGTDDPVVLAKYLREFRLVIYPDPTINPDPNAGPSSHDILGQPYCGADENTWNRAGKCNLPVLCTEGQPDENCQCSTWRNDSELWKNMQASACTNVTCPEGQAPRLDGMFCACGEAMETELKGPPRPLPVIVDTYFERRESSTHLEEIQAEVEEQPFEAWIKNLILNPEISE